MKRLRPAPGETVDDRLRRMIEAYLDMDIDDEILVHGGYEYDEKNEMQEAAIVIEIADEFYGFTSSQARAAADWTEILVTDHINECTEDECLFIHIPMLIQALRDGADQSDLIFRKRLS